VVVHQPAAVPHAGERPNLLRGHAAATRAWSAAGADLVMGGHIHLPYTLPLPGLARPLWVVQAGTAVSSRTRPRAPNSVNLLRWGAATGRCVVERWDYAAEAQAFGCADTTTVEPARA
jgi:hypothetical protein